MYCDYEVALLFWLVNEGVVRVTDFIVTLFSRLRTFLLTCCIKQHIMSIDDNLIVFVLTNFLLQVSYSIFMNSFLEVPINGKCNNFFCSLSFWLSQVNWTIKILCYFEVKLTSSFTLTLSFWEFNFVLVGWENVDFIIRFSICIFNNLILNFLTFF